MVMSPHERDRMQRRLLEVQEELDALLLDAEEEDELASARADALRQEVERLERALDPDLAEKRRAHGRSEQD